MALNSRIFLLGFLLAIAASGCHRTRAAAPSRMSGQARPRSLHGLLGFLYGFRLARAPTVQEHTYQLVITLPNLNQFVHVQTAEDVGENVQDINIKPAKVVQETKEVELIEDLATEPIKMCKNDKNNMCTEQSTEDEKTSTDTTAKVNSTEMTEPTTVKHNETHPYNDRNYKFNIDELFLTTERIEVFADTFMQTQALPFQDMNWQRFRELNSNDIRPNTWNTI